MCGCLRAFDLSRTAVYHGCVCPGVRIADANLIATKRIGSAAINACTGHRIADIHIPTGCVSKQITHYGGVPVSRHGRIRQRNKAVDNLSILKAENALP